MPTHLPPEIQNTLAGFWCSGQSGVTADILASLLGGTLPAETVRDWIELVRYIPPAMLRPSDPPAAHWHARWAEYCEGNPECPYGTRWLIQHHLDAGQQNQAIHWLCDFDYLYRRLGLDGRQARQIWLELQQLPAERRPREWEAFWRGRQFLVNPADPNPDPQLTFLALADAYAADSNLSRQAQEWLERVGPERPWLRLRFRPQEPVVQPLIVEVPEGDFQHEWVTQLLFSPDGSRLLTVTSGGRAHAWEVHSGRDLGALELPPALYHWSGEGLLALAESRLLLLDPDTFQVREEQRLPGSESWGRHLAAAGGRLATSNRERQVLLWDWRERRSLAVLPAPERGLQELFLSRDGGRVTVLSETEAHGCDLDSAGQARRYHRNTQRPWSERWGPRVHLRDQQLRIVDGPVLSAGVDEIWEWCSQQGWAVFSEHGSWQLWDLEQGRRLAEFGWPLPDARVYRDKRERYLGPHGVLGRAECVAVDGARRRALTWKLGASAAEIQDLEHGQVLATLAGQRDALVGGTLSGDGRRAATVTKAGNLRIWEAGNGKCLRLLKGRSLAVALNADGSLALSGDAEGQVRLWNLARGHCLKILEGHSRPIQWLAFAQGGLLLSGDREGFRIWDCEGICLAEMARPPQLYAREVSPCGRYLYAEEPEGAALIYDLDQGRVETRLPCPAAKPAAARFSEDSRQLAVSNQEGQFFQSCSLRVWQGAEALESYRVPLPYNALALNERHLAASCKGNQVRIWPRSAAHTPGHDAAVLCLDRQAGTLISGSIDKSARIWDLQSGRCLRQLSGDERWVQAVGLRGPYAFCATDQGARLWDLERGDSRATEHFPRAVNGQGEVLVSEGKQLLWWNPRIAGSKPLRLGLQPPSIQACAFSPDGKRAVSTNPQGELKLWDVASKRCLKSWQTPPAELPELQWLEPEEQPGPALEFGNGRPLRVDASTHWWVPIERALSHDGNRIVAAQDTGELHFLELLPAGPVGPRPGPGRIETTGVRPRRSGLQRTPLDRLEACRRILLVAAGGRSDLLASVPLAQLLGARGQQVFLAAPLSGRKYTRCKEVPPRGKAFENRLAALLERPLFAFAPEGTLPRLEVYRDLVERVSADGLVLVEAGVETLLRGDEPSLGTAADDLVSLAAARQLDLPVKMLANLGFGFDLGKGLCHAYTLEAIAELSRGGGFWGSFSLLPGQSAFALLLEAARLLAPSHPFQQLMQGLAGEFGGEHYLNPLMNQVWCFDLEQVARRCRPLEWLEEKITALDVHRALTNYLSVREERPWTEIPC
ncbi:hypothetical protein ABS71_02780 [bacterium SCN 62-11]|nr:DUF1152 domain-containing protein [Candidatus Eremiobacteraeota bacterium]ODT77135.1 MAG: hypothetical protein ABS71_02780 [bacterium SCN 62-11]